MCTIHSTNASGLRDCNSTRPGPAKSNTKSSPLSPTGWCGLRPRGAAGTDAQVVGDDVAGVDRDHLLELQVHDVHGAIDADQRLAVAGGPLAEAAFTAEQVGHAAPLSADLDTDHRQRLWRRTAGMDDGPGRRASWTWITVLIGLAFSGGTIGRPDSW